MFFIKQKTAYEMRISDWSSDVCSSDICCGNAPPPAKSPERDSAYRRVEVRHFDVVETGVHRRLRVRRQLREVGTPIRTIGAIRRVLQIGRPSGRERGCQYG